MSEEEADTAIKRQSDVKPIRLAIVVPSLEGGVGFLSPIVETFASKGPVRVFTGISPREPAPFPIEVVSGRVLREEVEETGYNARAFIYTSPRLILRLRRWRPDAIMTVEYGVATLWSLAARWHRRCIVAISQEHITPPEYLRSPARHLFRLLLARLADVLVANSKEAATEIITLLRVPRDKVVELQLLLPPQREYLLAEPIQLPRPQYRPIFLFVGQLIGRKNPRVLLAAADRLVRDGREFTIWIVGDGPDREALEWSVKRAGLQDVVTFLGAVPYRRMGHVYETADVFVMPTLAEVLSRAVLEAMRFEKPIIGSKLGGYAGNVVRDHVNGFLFDPANVTELADHMRTYIADPALAREMGGRSAEWFAGTSHEASADQLLQVLRSRLHR
jgi:glycosyltransferase involved in cell wall biosynthesis